MYATKKTNKTKGNRGWGYYGNKRLDDHRHKELDPSKAIAITAGEQPTLAKRRRKLADEKSVVTQSDIDNVFDDLVRHKDQIQKDQSFIKARKRFWKHQLSGLSTLDFQNIWKEARVMFISYQNKKHH